MGKTIAIVSGKGGTGKTMFAANLGASLSKLGKKVILVDMDTGLRNLDLYLGLESKVVYDVGDVMNGLCRIRQAIIKDKIFPGLHFMAASPKKGEEDLTPMHVRALCDRLMDRFDYVIMDAPAGVDKGLDMVLGGADEVIVVINPEISSMRDAELVTSVLKDKGMYNIYYVVNKINLKLMNEGLCPSMGEITRGINNRVIGLIREDENIHISTNLGVPIVYNDSTAVAENFRKIAMRVDEI